MAGSLNWYAEVLQSGRSHLRSWWLYCKFKDQLGIAHRLKLIEDTKWWISVLGKWSASELSNKEYPILSSSMLLKDADSIWFIQSDASGPDGFGYFSGGLSEDDPEYYSAMWGNGYSFESSHNGELQALLHFVRVTKLSDRVLVWISDCLAAIWSINKGRCHADVSLIVIEEILEKCDDKGLQLLGLWVHREHNELADYLSHLSTLVNRNEVQGRVAGL